MCACIHVQHACYITSVVKERVKQVSNGYKFLPAECVSRASGPGRHSGAPRLHHGSPFGLPVPQKKENIQNKHKATNINGILAEAK